MTLGGESRFNGFTRRTLCLRLPSSHLHFSRGIFCRRSALHRLANERYTCALNETCRKWCAVDDLHLENVHTHTQHIQTRSARKKNVSFGMKAHLFIHTILILPIHIIKSRLSAKYLVLGCIRSFIRTEYSVKNIVWTLRHTSNIAHTRTFDEQNAKHCTKRNELTESHERDECNKSIQRANNNGKNAGWKAKQKKIAALAVDNNTNSIVERLVNSGKNICKKRYIFIFIQANALVLLELFQLMVLLNA